VYLKTVIFCNRAPFGNSRFDFEDKEITVLSGINGSGKTTLLSYVVDAIYEIAKLGFDNEFEYIKNKYYRISSSIYTTGNAVFSFVYVRFLDGDNYIDYVDFRGDLSETDYEKNVLLDNKIPYGIIGQSIGSQQSAKIVCKGCQVITDSNVVTQLFDNNVLTYFPAYRHEKVMYLNDPYQVTQKFATESKFVGFLKNRIEVMEDLPNVVNWIMDLLLDCNDYGLKNDSLVRSNINTIVQKMLNVSENSRIRIGVGPRNFGAKRLQIVKDCGDNKIEEIYPSIYSMSSGELSLFCLFVELLMQADKIGKNISDVEGIVLIDEVDKHIHLNLQRRNLPQLLHLFPGVQFIVTSHSPFFALGLSDCESLQYRIIDLDNGGVECSFDNNDIFRDAFDAMEERNKNYKKLYDDVMRAIKEDGKPLIITEGKSDIIHLKAAQLGLKLDVSKYDFYDVPDKFGSAQLKTVLEYLKKAHPKRKVIGIFDRDIDQSKDRELYNMFFGESKEYICLGDNIFAFVIPVVNNDMYHTDKISIEHYYDRFDLLESYENNMHLYLGEKFTKSGQSIDGSLYTKVQNIQHKIEVNGIIDEKVFLSGDKDMEHSVALSKVKFAELMLSKAEHQCRYGYPEVYRINFSNFGRIFDVIGHIVNGVENP